MWETYCICPLWCTAKISMPIQVNPIVMIKLFQNHFSICKLFWTQRLMRCIISGPSKCCCNSQVLKSCQVRIHFTEAIPTRPLPLVCVGSNSLRKPMTQNASHTGQRRWQQKERTIKWFCKQKPCKVCLFESFSSLTPKYMVDICRDEAYMKISL